MNPGDLEFSLVPRQQFGQRLRELRDDAGMQSQDLARTVGISADLASRIELGQRWPGHDVVVAWARATGNEDLAGELTATRKELKQREARLRAESQTTTLAQKLRSDLFRKSAEIRTFAITDIPFYLQTVEYARRSLPELAGADDVVALRRTDSQAVGSDGKNFQIVLAESALRFFPCSSREMRRQLSDLQRLIDLPGVEFGVIPLGTQVLAPMLNAFTIFDQVAVVESFAGAIDLTPKGAPRYHELMDRLRRESVRGDEARTLLTAATNALPAS